MNTQAEVQPKKKRGRSPSYPSIDLQTAMGRARELYQQERINSASVIVVLKHWGYSAKSGLGLVTLAALIKFGLLADEGTGDKRKVRLTELARRVILDDRSVSLERDAAIREAALTPIIHRELWEQYKGNLPSDENLGHELRFNRGFTDYAAQELTKELRSTVGFAKLSDYDSISSTPEDKSLADGELKMTPPPETIEQASKPATTQASSAPKAPSQSQVSTTQVNRTVQIPLTGAPWALLQIPFPLSEDNWKELEQYLALMKKPLTTPNK